MFGTNVPQGSHISCGIYQAEKWWTSMNWRFDMLFRMTNCSEQCDIRFGGGEMPLSSLFMSSLPLWMVSTFTPLWRLKEGMADASMNMLFCLKTYKVVTHDAILLRSVAGNNGKSSEHQVAGLLYLYHVVLWVRTESALVPNSSDLFIIYGITVCTLIL
jgi:hypothetical protein